MAPLCSTHATRLAADDPVRRIAYAIRCSLTHVSIALSHPFLPITYGFSIAYIMLCVGVGTPSSRPSSTTLPLSQGSSSRLPRSRSSAIEAFMSGGM